VGGGGGGCKHGRVVVGVSTVICRGSGIRQRACWMTMGGGGGGRTSIDGQRVCDENMECNTQSFGGFGARAAIVRKITTRYLTKHGLEEN
jgi:hypothetical protein